MVRDRSVCVCVCITVVKIKYNTNKKVSTRYIYSQEIATSQKTHRRYETQVAGSCVRESRDLKTAEYGCQVSQVWR